MSATQFEDLKMKRRAVGCRINVGHFVTSYIFKIQNARI